MDEVISASASDGDEGTAASMVESLVSAIVEGVMKGRYAPGQRLIAGDLAAEYDVSRAPVREALHVLAGEGVVELIANRGARIRKMSADERIEFLEFTEAICVLGVRLAAARTHEDKVRQEIERAFQAIEEAYQRRHSVDFVEALYQYHIELNRVSGNQFLYFFYRRPYIRFYTTLLSDLAPADHWDGFIRNYRLIHETLISGDANSAAVMFSSHIRWVLRNMRADSHGVRR